MMQLEIIFITAMIDRMKKMSDGKICSNFKFGFLKIISLSFINFKVIEDLYDR